MSFIFDSARAARLRRELALLLNRDVRQQEVAAEVSRRLAARGGSRRSVSDQVVRRLEHGRVQRLDLEVVNALAAFYGAYGLDVTTLIRYAGDAPRPEGDAPRPLSPSNT